MLDLAIIIVSWNVRDYLRDCLTSVYAELHRSGITGAVWVVDNGSTDGTLSLLKNLFPQVRLITNQENVGFGAANNQGMKAAAAESPRYYFLLNPDTLVRVGAFKKMLTFMDARPDVGVAGARLVYGDGRFQHSAFAFPGLRQLVFDLFPLPSRFYDSRWNGRYPRTYYRSDSQPFAVDHTLGATMMVRRDVAEATGGFDEAFHMYCEEIDWSWRIREAGWAIYTVPAAEVVHFGGESTKQIPARSVINLWGSRAQLYQKHYGPLKRRLAARLATLGLRRHAAASADPSLKEAYLHAAALWDRQ